MLDYVRKGERGIEIGPWFRPIAPKRAGYATLVVDAFPRDVLVARALSDADVPDHLAEAIEEVDLVATVDLADEIHRREPGARFSHIIASHVVEHLPDPLAFLHDCERLLEDDGVVSLAVPDKRICSDHFAPVSEAGAILAAHDERRRVPTPAQVFDFLACRARLDDGRIAFSLEADPGAIKLDGSLEDAEAAYTPGPCQRRVPGHPLLAFHPVELSVAAVGPGDAWPHRPPRAERLADGRVRVRRAPGQGHASRPDGGAVEGRASPGGPA
jgi:hypothetical protein